MTCYMLNFRLQGNELYDSKITMRISRNFSLNFFEWLSPIKTKTVSFFSLSHAFSDSVINFTQVRYQNLLFFRNT